MTQTIAYFTDSPGFGGAERALLQLLEGLDREQWRPVLFHHAEPGIDRLLSEAEKLRVPLRPVPHMPMGLGGARLIPAFMRAVQAERPAVFHAHLTWPLACKQALTGAVLARLPAVVATVQLFMDIPYSWSARLQQCLIATRVQRYFAVSQAIARDLHRVFGIPSRKLRVVYNAGSGSAPNLAASTETRRRLAGEPARPVVLTVARLEPQKGLEYWLRAAQRVPDARFVLAGDGPERPSLEALARQLGLEGRVVFLGQRGDVPALLAAADLFVLPSLYEGSPLALLEAMAAGKPVVATAIPGVDEIVTSGSTGCLVPPANPAALAEAITALLHDPARAQALALAGQAHARRSFSVEAMVQQVTGTYAELIHRGRNAGA